MCGYPFKDWEMNWAVVRWNEAKYLVQYCVVVASVNGSDLLYMDTCFYETDHSVHTGQSIDYNISFDPSAYSYPGLSKIVDAPILRWY